MKLIVCEKPDQAKQVANAIGGFAKKGMAWIGTFEGEETVVVACRGHLFMLKEPQEVMEGISWNDPHTLRPVPSTFSLKVIPDSPGFNGPQPKDYVKNIKNYIDKADEVIIATDSDREGEAIGWEVVYGLKFKGKVRRAWFSGGTDLDSYRKAMNNLYSVERTKSWARASEARGRSDWYYQLLVRGYTFYGSYGALGGNLGRGDTPQERVVSVGRVQLPVVKMVFDRDEEIRNFTSVDHHRVKADFTENNIEANYAPIVTREVIDSEPAGVHWEPSKTVAEDGKEAPLDRPLFVDKNLVDDFKKRLKAAGEATVTSFSSKTKESHPPKAFNLMGAQSEISKKYPKLDAEALQAIVEDLYEQGVISYPRTEHSEIPSSFYEKSERNAILGNLVKVPQLAEIAELAMKVHNGEHKDYKPFMPKGFSNKEMEHHGLLPTRQAMDGVKLLNLSAQKKGNRATDEMMQFAYLAIARQFITMMLPPAKVAEQKVEFTLPVTDLLGAKETIFRATAEQIVDQGWMAYSGSEKKAKEAISLKKGSVVKLNAVTSTASKTKPPSPYTEIALGEAMSNVGKNISDPKLKALLKHASGLGTPATRSSIVKTVKLRGYLETRGKTIHCTDKGADLLKVVPAKMTSPEMTAIWEDYLMQIQSEKDDLKAIEMRDQFVMKQRNMIEDLLIKLEETYRSKMQANRVSGGTANKKPTPKMIKAAKSIIDNSKGKIKAPRGLTTQFSVCKEFLDQHMTAGSPSEAQVNFAKSIFNGLSEEVKASIDTDSVFADRKLISEFIEAHKGSGVRKPSPAQLNLANKLIDQVPAGTKIPDNVLEDASVCSKFISTHIKKKK